jgi:hypothetical protein
MLKTEVLNMRITANEKKKIKKAASKAGVSVARYVITSACACGEAGYEGIFTSVSWTCGKCGKINSFKSKEAENGNK